MATYEGNAYEILSQVRIMLNEYSTAYIQGTDTSGAFQNAFIMLQINTAQRLIYNTLLRHLPDLFLKTTNITGSNSAFTLPADFNRVVQFRDADGYPVSYSGIRTTPNTLSGASKNRYYRKGNTLVVHRSGVSDTYELFYRSRPRLIHAGQASAGAATSITLDSSYAPKTVDYFNEMSIENITQDWVDTIDDYTAARVATISETAAASDYYGIVSDLPEPFHFLIAPRASMLCRARHPLSPEKPDTLEVALWQQDFRDTLIEYGVTAEDIKPEDIWTDFGPYGMAGIDIPGQGYIIPG